MAVELVKAAAASQVVGGENGEVVWILAGRTTGALGGIRVSGDGVSIAVDTRSVVSRIHDAQTVVLIEEGLLIDCASLDVVIAHGIGEVAVEASVGEGAILGD